MLFLHLPVVVLDVQISIGVFSSASEEPGCLLSFSNSLLCFMQAVILWGQRGVTVFLFVFLTFSSDEMIVFFFLSSRSDAESV